MKRHKKKQRELGLSASEANFKARGLNTCIEYIPKSRSSCSPWLHIYILTSRTIYHQFIGEPWHWSLIKWSLICVADCTLYMMIKWFLLNKRKHHDWTVDHHSTKHNNKHQEESLLALFTMRIYILYKFTTQENDDVTI